MPLNKLDNFIKNTEGRILYVSPSDLDSTDSISNQGNSLAQPFKTLQRALLEAARFSYQRGNSNDDVEKTTILLMPGQHTVDNRPGFVVYNKEGVARAVSPSGVESLASSTLTLDLNSVFDLTQEDNILYKFNSIYGGVVVPRGTSIVGLDLRKTKLRPKYVPNPTDSSVPNSAIFRITGAGYFWQFSIFDGSTEGTVYTDPINFSVNNQSIPTFSHHKLTCFEYADGVNKYETTDLESGLTDLDMYYAKLSNAFNLASGRDIDQKYPQNPGGFEKQRPEWEIVGAFAADPIQISTIGAGSGNVPNSIVTVKTLIPHGLTAGTQIKISGVLPEDYNISTKVQPKDPTDTDPTTFTYLLPNFRPNLPTPGSASSAFVTIETDTVSGASPYIFNISLRSVYGMNGMLADGSKASGFRSMVVAQFTAISLQKDDRAFVRYNPTNRNYSDSIAITKQTGASLSGNSSSTGIAYHLEPLSIYRSGWETSHIKATNDAFIQVVSVFAIGFNKHFDAETGSDLSITNSNSNFGQISLNSSGFKKEAFAKDNKAFITSIITPRTIVGGEDNIDWLQFDVDATKNVANNRRIYLFGFDSQDDVPPTLTQGYRIGAKVDDKLYIDVNGTPYSANILMSDRVTSSVKEYVSSVPSASNEFTLGTHNIQDGEKVIILSDVGDLPENIVENTVYYAIRSSSTKIKLASSKSAADSGTEIAVYGGTSLRILSRVSDKIAGDVEHPVQWDPTQSRWYITTNAGSDIYSAITNPSNTFEDGRTEPSYIKRIADSRSLDEKLYKIRVVIPKELVGAKNPEDGFVIQQTSSTGYRNNTDPTSSSITKSDYEYNKNLSLIAKCTRSGSTVTVISELPHNLQVGDSVIIKNVSDSTNASGEDNRGYNGTFTVSFVDDMTFRYTTTKTPGTTFTNNTTSRTISSPRFERNNLQSNIYNYRNEVITPYIEGIQDGVYHIYALIADKAVPTEFTNIKYSQNVVDLYPQLDRDNNQDNPPESKSFAKRAPLGEVVTNDLKKSITRESINTILTSFGIGLDISSVTNSTTTSPTITFAKRHGLAGIVTGNITPGADYTPGTYQNVKLLNDSQIESLIPSNWKGATARVVVSGSSNSITSVNIVSSGSGYSNGESLFFDSSVLGNGNNNARYTISTSGITAAIDNVVQFTGDGTTSDTYHRITAVSADNQISIARTTGDPVITNSQYAFVLGPSVQITNTNYDPSVGVRTFNCSAPHGLVAGNKFRLINSLNNNKGDYVVLDRLNTNSFTALTSAGLALAGGYILKHGLSANSASSDSDAENLAIRSVTFFDKETIVTNSGITTTSTTIPVSNTYVALTKRFPLGSYIQIDEEIMRIETSTLTSPSSGTAGIRVIRGVLATKQVPHDSGSLVRKIKPIPIEFRRPSIVRASGHTFEYLGYGPGNYSTGLPQVQVITLTEREEFLVQSQERSGGVVVYTGMNNNGDSFIGNRKTSSSTGEEITFDNPIPTITGEDPSRLSVIFDEVTVKERLVVEGGNSGAVLSQFDGPVTFNKGVKFNDNVNVKSELKVSNQKDSTSIANGALIVSGGVGIAKNLNVGGDLRVTGITTLTGLLDANGGATIDNIQIGVNGNNEIDTAPGTGNLILDSAGGTVEIDDNLEVKEDLYVGKNGGGNSIIYFYNDSVNNYNPKIEFTDVAATIDSNSVPGNTFYFNRRIFVNGALEVAGNVRLFQSDVFLGDNDDLYFGDGNDLRIYHNGTHSYIDVTSGATGDLYIRNTRPGGDVFIQADNDSGVLRNVFAATGSNSAAQLFYDGTKRFETTSTGAVVSGALSVTGTTTLTGLLDANGGATIDNIRIGVAGNNEIDTATGNLILDSAGGTVEIQDNLTVSGATTLSSNLGVTGATTLTGLLDANGGATIDNIRIGVAGNNEIDTATGNLILDSAGGTVEIQDNLTVSGTATFQSDVFLGDNDDLYFGDGNDLRIYHNGTHSYIDVTSGATGDLYIRNTRPGGAVRIQADNAASQLKNVFVATGADSAAQLFYDGTKRFETTSTGAVVSGALSVTGTTTLTGLLDANGGATIDNIRIGVAGNNEIDTATGNLILDSAGGTVEIQDNLTVSGTTTLTGLLDANGGATIDNITIGIAGNNEINTATGTGNLILDSAGGTVEIQDNLTVSGNVTFQSDVFLGDGDDLYFGASNDLRIFHNGSNSYIDVTSGATGNLYIRNQSTGSVILEGNSSTATKFSTDRTNYKGVTDESVAGQMMWKNYGNGHTIFDASRSTSPNGTSVNNTNAQNVWTGTYPTLMGWNGSQTFGVRVDSARYADGAGIAAGQVGTNELANNSVTAAKIADNAVGTTEIADYSVTAAKMGSGSVSILHASNAGSSSINLTLGSGTWFVEFYYTTHVFDAGFMSMVIDNTVVQNSPDLADYQGTFYVPMFGATYVSGSRTITCYISGAVANPTGDVQRCMVKATRIY